MPINPIAVGRARFENPNDFGTLQTLAIFCGVGLVFSTFLAANGWI